MKEFVNRYWVTLLGVLFLFGSFFTFFEMAMERGWLPPAARVAIGIASGATVAYISWLFYRRDRKLMAEIIAGLSSGLFFLTIAYAGFSENIMWSQNVLLISMMGLGTVILGVGYQFRMRILVIISVISGLFTPLLIRATPEQVNVLFFYVLIINVVALLLSVIRKWPELRLVSFFSTVAIFITYYFYFDPESWGKPFFYVSSLFVVYMIGLFATSKAEENRFSGLNFYLGIVNSVHYVFWSVYIFSSFELSYALPTFIVALSFLSGSLFIYLNNKNEVVPALAYFLLSLFALALSGEDFSQIFSTDGMPYVINCTLWLSIALLIYGVGYQLKNKVVSLGGLALWVMVIIYWYTVAWDVEWIEWFGLKFIPFINPGALLWIGIATSAFILARQAASNLELEEVHRDLLALFLAIAGHLVVGGLIAIQIDNCWDAYPAISLDKGMIKSTAWFIYAFGLFLWGKHSREKAFMWFGGLVLISSSIKMWVFDLPGEATIYKVIFLFLSGLVILAIGYVHRIWIDEEEKSESKINV